MGIVISLTAKDINFENYLFLAELLFAQNKKFVFTSENKKAVHARVRLIRDTAFSKTMYFNL